MRLQKRASEPEAMDEIVMYNRRFVQERRYERYQTEKYPKKNCDSDLYGYETDRTSARGVGTGKR